jgi:hypothetical protein
MGIFESTRITDACPFRIPFRSRPACLRYHSRDSHVVLPASRKTSKTHSVAALLALVTGRLDGRGRAGGRLLAAGAVFLLRDGRRNPRAGLRMLPARETEKGQSRPAMPSPRVDTPIAQGSGGSRTSASSQGRETSARRSLSFATVLTFSSREAPDLELIVDCSVRAYPFPKRGGPN